MTKNIRDWTVQIFYDARDDAGRTFRATSVYHAKATNIGAAYAGAEEALGPLFKLGAIIPGNHERFP